MAKIMTLDGAPTSGLGESRDCRCIYNPRTKRGVKQCFVGKSAKNRSGFAFVKGGCNPTKK